MLNSSHIAKHDAVYTQNSIKQNPYEMQVGKGDIENLTWLLG
jgi:hypothetical protein